MGPVVIASAIDQAQQAPVTDAATAEESGSADIVVIARKDSKNLQSVPVAVTALKTIT